VGNHTFSHNLRKLAASFDKGTSEVSRTGAMIERLGGDGRMVRIPYGASGKALVSKVAAEGAQIFHWDINSYDTTRKGVRNHLFIENAVQRQLKGIGKRHVILLFHDGSGHDATLAAIRDLIPKLKREGYRFGVLAGSERVAKASIGHKGL
jgi:peptidoglycan/xylan/chitin deacetylase (PgdA/CDA1 family)